MVLPVKWMVLPQEWWVSPGPHGFQQRHNWLVLGFRCQVIVADALPLGLKRHPFWAAEERSATISVQKGEQKHGSQQMALGKNAL